MPDLKITHARTRFSELCESCGATISPGAELYRVEGWDDYDDPLACSQGCADELLLSYDDLDPLAPYPTSMDY